MRLVLQFKVKLLFNLSANMYTLVKKTKVTKTIELLSPLNECCDSEIRSHFHGLNVRGETGLRGNGYDIGNDHLGGRSSFSGVHRSNSIPSKPIGRKGSFGGSSTNTSHSFSSHGACGGLRKTYQHRFFDDDYLVTHTSSTSRCSSGARRHQSVTRRNEDNCSSDEFKNG